MCAIIDLVSKINLCLNYVIENGFKKKNQKYQQWDQQWHQQQQQEQTEVNDTKNLRNYEQRPPSNMNEFKQKPITEELKELLEARLQKPLKK